MLIKIKIESFKFYLYKILFYLINIKNFIFSSGSYWKNSWYRVYNTTDISIESGTELLGSGGSLGVPNTTDICIKSGTEFSNCL